METKTIREGFVMGTRYGWLTKGDFIKACKWEVAVAYLLENALKETIGILKEMDGKFINKTIAAKAQKMLDDKGIEVNVEYANEYLQLRFVPKNPYSEERQSDGTSFYSEQVAAVRLQWHGNKKLDSLNSAGEWNKAIEWREHIIGENNDAAVNYDKYALMNAEMVEMIEKYKGDCNPLLKMNVQSVYLNTERMYD
ncbi:MAG: hypothetical protein LUD72_12240 [Bacteroidales bacterium]|nr:hypothetical protein [Bacteroidales bacterium]